MFVIRRLLWGNVLSCIVIGCSYNQVLHLGTWSSLDDLRYHSNALVIQVGVKSEKVLVRTDLRGLLFSTTRTISVSFMLWNIVKFLLLNLWRQKVHFSYGRVIILLLLHRWNHWLLSTSVILKLRLVVILGEMIQLMSTSKGIAAMTVGTILFYFIFLALVFWNRHFENGSHLDLIAISSVMSFLNAKGKFLIFFFISGIVTRNYLEICVNLYVISSWNLGLPEILSLASGLNYDRPLNLRLFILVLHVKLLLALVAVTLFVHEFLNHLNVLFSMFLLYWRPFISFNLHIGIRVAFWLHAVLLLRTSHWWNESTVLTRLLLYL